MIPPLFATLFVVVALSLPAPVLADAARFEDDPLFETIAEFVGVGSAPSHRNRYRRHEGRAVHDYHSTFPPKRKLAWHRIPLLHKNPAYKRHHFKPAHLHHHDLRHVARHYHSRQHRHHAGLTHRSLRHHDGVRETPLRHHSRFRLQNRRSASRVRFYSR